VTAIFLRDLLSPLSGLCELFANEPWAETHGYALAPLSWLSRRRLLAGNIGKCSNFAQTGAVQLGKLRFSDGWHHGPTPAPWTDTMQTSIVEPFQGSCSDGISTWGPIQLDGTRTGTPERAPERKNGKQAPEWQAPEWQHQMAQNGQNGQRLNFGYDGHSCPSKRSRTRMSNLHLKT